MKTAKQAKTKFAGLSAKLLIKNIYEKAEI